MLLEIVLMWIAATAYTVSTALFVGGLTLEREKWVKLGVPFAFAGALAQVGAFAVRWVRIGHGPCLGFYEAMSALAFSAVVAFLLLVWRNPKYAPAGIAVMPLALLLVGAAMLSPKGGVNISPSLASYWLFIHVIFSDLAFGGFVVSFALAVVYLLRSRSYKGRWSHHLERLPDQESVDHLSSRFAVAGFIFWGIMIVSGAIWANEAWGRYWGWDPIETWSLVVWLIYAGYLHLRYTMGWRGERLAWVAVIAMPLSLFSLVGIPIIFKSIHGAYLTGLPE